MLVLIDMVIPLCGPSERLTGRPCRLECGNFLMFLGLFCFLVVAVHFHFGCVVLYFFSETQCCLESIFLLLSYKVCFEVISPLFSLNPIILMLCLKERRV